MPLTLEQSLHLQKQFAAHIRDPLKIPRPSQISDQRMQVYRDLFFSSLSGFLDDTFTQLQVLIESQDSGSWRALNRAFFSAGAAQSPYFHRISQEFLKYLESSNQLDPALMALAYYEQTHFNVLMSESEPNEVVNRALEWALCSDDTLLSQCLRLRKDAQLLAVTHDIKSLQKVSVWDNSMATYFAIPSFFVFSKNRNNNVFSTQLTPMNAALLELIQAGVPPKAAFEYLAKTTSASVDQLQGFGLEYLRQSLGPLLCLQD